MERPSGRRQLVLAALTITLAAAGAYAGSPQSFEIALPETEGPLTMAVFSADGRRIRTLCRDADAGSMQAGLNGVILSWDGMDDAGAEAMPGEYRVRGLVHGPVGCTALPFVGTDDSDPWNGELASFPPEDRIVLRAHRDALFEQSPLVTVRVIRGDGAWCLEADGIPLWSAPAGLLPGEGKATLRHGPIAGTALLSVRNGRKIVTVHLAGLDGIVSLNAGRIDFPSRSFHSAPDSGESLPR
jgi:hypothetical protein